LSPSSVLNCINQPGCFAKANTPGNMERFAIMTPSASKHFESGLIYPSEALEFRNGRVGLVTVDLVVTGSTHAANERRPTHTGHTGEWPSVPS
jgi:hypothetical protein